MDAQPKTDVQTQAEAEQIVALTPKEQVQRSIDATAEQYAQKMPAPEPVVKTETEQHLDNAVRKLVGLEPVMQANVDTAQATEYDNSNISQEGAIDYGTGTKNDYGGNGRNEEIRTGIQPSRHAEYGTGNVQSGNQGGIPGRNGEGTVYPADSEGRSITQEVSSRIQNTAIRDTDGKPLAVYHFTDNMDFKVFAKGDTGFHFGSIEQAQKRAVDKNTASGRIFRAYLDIKNDERNWGGNAYEYALTLCLDAVLKL